MEARELLISESHPRFPWSQYVCVEGGGDQPLFSLSCSTQHPLREGMGPMPTVHVASIAASWPHKEVVLSCGRMKPAMLSWFPAKAVNIVHSEDHV